jgi:hypothetical protein
MRKKGPAGRSVDACHAVFQALLLRKLKILQNKQLGSNAFYTV